MIVCCVGNTCFCVVFLVGGGLGMDGWGAVGRGDGKMIRAFISQGILFTGE